MGNDLTSQAIALDWANRHRPFEHWETVSVKPWSRVYHLTGRRGDTYLKLLPHGMVGEIDVLQAFDGSGCRSIPQAVAQDSDLGLLLMEDHGGKAEGGVGVKEQTKAVRAYVDLQVKSMSLQPQLSTLPRFQADGLVRQIDALVGEEGEALLVRCLPLGEAISMARALSSSEASIRVAASLPNPLPLLLEHGDLHPGNLAFRPDGSVVIFDWADALWAPAGFSIPFLVGGATAAIRQMRARGPGLCWTYLAALSDTGYATRSELELTMRGNMVAGVIHAIVGFAALRAVDDRAMPFIGRQVQGAVNDLLAAVRS
jgi:aminoglycoside/choline kinase family phosphotransferase